MESTKNIKFEFSQTDELRSLIESTYFDNGNNGKLSDTNTEHLVIDQGDVIYQVLSGLNYDVKLRNAEIIEGMIRFKVKEEGSNIILSPMSKYCIKVNTGIDDKERYCFY